jgi:hypothetical protein
VQIAPQQPRGCRAPGRHWRTACFGSMLSVATVCLPLVCIEQYFRSSRPDLLAGTVERDHFCMYDPEIGWVNRPNAKGKFSSTSVRVNSQGLRDREHSLDKGPQFRVLVLGDSFVWGCYAEQDELFTEVLEQRLGNCEVINMGCSGYGQDQELLLLKREGLKYSPDLVIVNVHFDSDIWNNVHSVAYGYNKPLFINSPSGAVLHNVPVPKCALGGRISRWMTGWSATWNRMKACKMGDSTIDKWFVTKVNRWARQGDAISIISDIPREAMMVNLLKEMKTVATTHGAEFLVLLTPNVEVGTQRIIPSEQFDSVTDSLLAADIPLINLQDYFSRYFREYPDARLTLDYNRHWSPLGHRVVADCLEEYVTSHVVHTLAVGNDSDDEDVRASTKMCTAEEQHGDWNVAHSTGE